MTACSGGVRKLSLGRMRVVPVGVALANPAIAPVYEQLGALRLRDLARRIHCRMLGRVHRGSPLRTRTAYRPSVLVPNDVLVAFCHDLDLPFSVYGFVSHDNM